MDKKRILVIDDEESLTRGIKINLEATEKYEVRTANSGAEGLAAAREHRPDLIVMDLMMPLMDGSEVAAMLAQDADLARTPILFLTALAEGTDTSSPSGAVAGHPVMAKPVRIRELIDRIEASL